MVCSLSPINLATWESIYSCVVNIRSWKIFVHNISLIFHSYGCVLVHSGLGYCASSVVFLEAGSELDLLFTDHPSCSPTSTVSSVSISATASSVCFYTSFTRSSTLLFILCHSDPPLPPPPSPCSRHCVHVLNTH